MKLSRAQLRNLIYESLGLAELLTREQISRDIDVNREKVKEYSNSLWGETVEDYLEKGLFFLIKTTNDKLELFTG